MGVRLRNSHQAWLTTTTLLDGLFDCQPCSGISGKIKSLSNDDLRASEGFYHTSVRKIRNLKESPAPVETGEPVVWWSGLCDQERPENLLEQSFCVLSSRDQTITYMCSYKVLVSPRTVILSSSSQNLSQNKRTCNNRSCLIFAEPSWPTKPFLHNLENHLELVLHARLRLFALLLAGLHHLKVSMSCI